MRFYKTLLVSLALCSLSSLAFSDDKPAKEKADSTQITPEELAKANAMLNLSQKKAIDSIVQEQNTKPDLTDILDSTDTLVEQHTKQAENIASLENKVTLSEQDIRQAQRKPDFQQYSEMMPQFMDENMSNMADVPNKDTRYGEDIYAYIAVSQSQPKEWFESLYLELSTTYKDKNVVVAFQGAPKGQLATFALAIEQAMPDNNDGRYAIVVDPIIFERMQVDKVPMFIIRTDKGWRKTLGEMSLSQAHDYARQDYNVFSATGKTYDIAEPNMMTLMKEAMAKQFAEEDVVGNMQQQVRAQKPALVSLTNAESPSTYMVDPTFTVNEDMIFDGVVFAKKGDKVNPLESMPLTETYAFADLTNPAHVELLQQWKNQFPSLRVFSTIMPSVDQKKTLISQFGYLSQINKLLVDRFSISEIPAIAMQQGVKLRVEVVPVKPTENNKRNDILVDASYE
jgi:conjugal transfer pilus assembly protein TraW